MRALRRTLECFAWATAWVALFETAASATPAGIDRYSGEGGGATCAACHAGGALEVSLSGPTALTAGQTGDYTFSLVTDSSATGMNAAAPDGVVLRPGTNTRELFGEITHPRRIASVEGRATYTFQLVAPSTNGVLTLWVAGVAADGVPGVGGDRSGATSREIAVTGGVDPLDAGPAEDARAPEDASPSPDATPAADAGRDAASVADAAIADAGRADSPSSNTDAGLRDEPASAEAAGCADVGAFTRDPLAWVWLSFGLVVILGRRRRAESR